MRKFLSFFFSIALAMTMLPATAFAVPDDGESQLVDVPQASEAALVIESQAGNIASGTWGTCPWEISEDGVLTVHPGEGAESTNPNYSPWIDYVENITKVVFVREGGKRVMAPSACTALFARMPNITEIDFSGFDTSKTTAMNEMFIQCTALTSVDFSNLDTSNVTTTMTMFGGCISLASINLSGVNTSKLRWADYMFSGCSSLESIDVSSFNTSNVTSMFCMFNGCSSLKSLDLSNFDTTNVTNVRNVLTGCSSLERLAFGEKNTKLVLPSNEVNGHVDWYSFKEHRWQTADEIATSSGAFGTYIKDEPSITAAGSWGTCPWELSEDGALTVYPGVGTPVYVFRNNKFEDLSPWKEFRDKRMIKKISFLEKNGNKVIAPENSRRLFHDMRLEQIDLSGIDTSNVTSMQSMFSMAGTFNSIDLSSFDTSNVTTMEDMFYSCEITSLDLSNFNTLNVTTMNSMFNKCSKLETLDLSSFQTFRVTNMGSMFKGCSSLQSIELSNFSTPVIEWTNNMFSECSSLECLNLSNMQTSTATNISSMFRNCSSLKAVDLSGFSISATTQSSFLLEGCTALQSITLGERIKKFSMPGTEWLSTSENKWFTAKEIQKTRLGIADTYTDFRSSFDEVDIDYGPGSYTYTGHAIKPELTLIDSNTGYRLIENKDYMVTLSGDTVNVSGSWVDVEINGIGNYKGLDHGSFEIVPAPVTSIQVKNPKLSWSDAPQRPEYTVKSSENILEEWHDFYPDDGDMGWKKDSGKYTVPVVAFGNYSGTLLLNFEIAPAPLTRVYVSQDEFVYNGTEQRPSIMEVCTTINDAPVHVENEYYDIVYPECSVQPGTYYVTVKGKGNCTGTVTAKYEILPDPNSAVDPVLPSDTPDSPDSPDTPNTPDNSDTPNLPTQTVTQTMFRLYNPNSGEHFYTSSTVERDSIIAVGWQDEGTGWIAPTEGDPVYRLYNQYAGEHHYTTSVIERDMLVSVGWNDEGIGWYAGGERPLYRLYNPNAYANNHHYSTDVGERDILISIGWQDEGIAWYGVG